VAASLPVLVVDSVEELAKQDPAFLEVLQNFAKKCADKRSLRVFFRFHARWGTRPPGGRGRG